MTLNVNESSPAVTAMALDWAILEALNGGTRAMRKASTTYLPQWPAEEAASYQARLAVATLFPAYERTVRVMAAKPFAKALTLAEDTPTAVQGWCEDIDRQGVSLHNFAAEMFVESFYGLAGVLVDFPDTRQRDAAGRPVEGPAERTVAQVEAQGLRPYFVRVHHRQILGWRTGMVGGRLQLTQLRLLESREVPDGMFGTADVARVRVLTPGAWQVWEEVTNGTGKGWQVVDAGRTSLPYIPFVPFYGVREGFMAGKPPLMNLAYLNIKHWQSQSDQDTILHVARVPILAMIGADDGTGLKVGAASAVKLPLGAEMKFVEHSGAAIKAGADSLLALEEQMIQSGAELLVKKPGQRSATESANDAEGNKSDLQRLTETFEDALDAALDIMCDYARVKPGVHVSLFKDFGAATLSDASATLIKDLQQTGLLSKATALKELQRRGVLAAEIDVDDELEQAEKDGPPPGTMETDAEGNPIVAPAGTFA